MSQETSDRVSIISIVFPVFNEEGNLEMLYEKVKAACNEADVTYEMIFVDDGSKDDSLALIKDLRKKDVQIHYVSLSRNFGHQNALFAGMSKCSGDAVITMDADLQHPPSLIPKMINLWRKGAEVVYTTKEEANLPLRWRLTMKIFYWLFSKISNLKLNFGQSDFRLLDKKVLKIILEIPEYHKFLRGQVEWIGFKQTGLSYKVDNRYSGKSKFSYSSRIPTALDGIFAFSKYPLRLVTIFSVFVAFFSFVYMIFIALIWLLVKLNIVTNVIVVPGWATSTIAVFFLGSVQLIFIGILGEYISRTYEQTKGRPIFIARETSEGG